MLQFVYEHLYLHDIDRLSNVQKSNSKTPDEVDPIFFKPHTALKAKKKERKTKKGVPIGLRFFLSRVR